MPELPKSIRVGYRTYAVEDWPAIQASAAARWGECDPTNLVIRVRVDLAQMIRAEVLLHEVLHAAYDMGRLEPGADEEKTVSVLANQLAQVWRDNPDLVSFLSESLS